MGVWRKRVHIIGICAWEEELSVQPTRKDGGRVFVKRPDPHEEALTILKEQMSHKAAVPGTQVRGSSWRGPGRLGGKGGLRGSLGNPLPLQALALPPPLNTVFGVRTGAQRGRGPGEASEQHSKATHGAHSR